MTAHAQPSLTFVMFSCVSRWIYILISLVRKSNQAGYLGVVLVEVAFILVENNTADYFRIFIIAEPP